MERDHTIDKKKTLVQYLQDSVFWIYMGLLLFYGIIMVSLLASLSTELTDLKQSDSFILARENINAWKKNYIIELTASDGECPSGYESLVNYNWAGTVDGCGCDFESQNVTQTIVVKGRCNSELIGFGCFDIQSQSSINGQYWKNGKKICALRDNQSMADSMDEKCELGQLSAKDYKKCGGGSQTVCRSNVQECPVSHIESKQHFVGQNNPKELSISSNTIYTYESDILGYMPIMDFRFDEFDHCINPKQHNISPNKTGEYILLKERRENCKETETRTFKLDDIGEEDLFRNNNRIWTTTTQDLKGYPRPSNYYNYKLSYQPYPFWSFECRNNPDYMLRTSIGRFELNQEQDQEDHLLITTIISCSFVSIILVAAEVINKRNRNRELISIKQIQSDNKKYRSTYAAIPKLHRSWLNRTIFLIIADKSFKIVNVFSIFIVYQELKLAKNWFIDIKTQSCGDDYYYNNIHIDYENATYKMFQLISAMMGLWWTIISIDLMFMIFRYITEFKPILDELAGKRDRVLNKKSLDQLKLQEKEHAKRMQAHDDDPHMQDIEDDEEEEEKLPDFNSEKKDQHTELNQEEIKVEEVEHTSQITAQKSQSHRASMISQVSPKGAKTTLLKQQPKGGANKKKKV